MKILVVTTGFPYFENTNLAHACKFVYYECLAYEKAGAEVEVITPGIPGIPKEDIVGENIKVHRFNYFFPKKWQTVRRADGLALYTKMNIWFFIQLPFFLFSFCRAVIKHGRNSDILHCSWTLSALLAFPLRWLFGVPITLTMRGSDTRLMPGWINRWVCRNVDANLFAYAHIPLGQKKVKDYPGKYILDIPLIVPKPTNGTDCSTVEKSEGVFLVIFIGRFDTYKLDIGVGFFTLLEAINILSKNYPQIRCIYIGDGEFRDKLEKTSSELKIDDIVEFAGYQMNVYSYVKEADLVVGGMDLDTVSQEATVNGKVQLMPRIKDWYEGLWFDRENALLYEAENAESMANAIEFSILNKSEMKNIAIKAIETGNKYIKNVNEGGIDYLKSFKEIIEHRLNRRE